MLIPTSEYYAAPGQEFYNGPGLLTFIHERSHPMARDAACGSLTLSDVLDLGLTPLCFKATERWLPLARRLSERYGYALEWTPNPKYQEWIGMPGTLRFTRNA